ISRPIVVIDCMIWLLRIVGLQQAPTFMALTCRWRSRPQHQHETRNVRDWIIFCRPRPPGRCRRWRPFPEAFLQVQPEICAYEPLLASKRYNLPDACRGQACARRGASRVVLASTAES